jgi:hypothetical protein
MTEAERDSLISDIRIDVAEIRVRIESVPDHEHRLRRLERFRYAFPSLATFAALGTIGLGIMHFIP